jgi:hypothetical protein
MGGHSELQNCWTPKARDKAQTKAEENRPPITEPPEGEAHLHVWLEKENHTKLSKTKNQIETSARTRAQEGKS